MKKLVLILGMLLLIFSLTGTASAQTTRQVDCDSLSVSTSAARESFSPRYESATFTFIGCEGQIKFAFSPSDTTWSDKTFFIMPANSSITIEKSRDLGIPGVQKIYYKCTSGTGALLIVGTRTNDAG